MNQVKTGVLLVNLGTPERPDAVAVRHYLKQFLGDRRVVDMPRWRWWPLLHGIILPLRAPRVAKLYADIWSEAGSPLLVYSQRLRDALTARLAMPVALGMTYGNPTLKSAVDSLIAQGITRLLVLPLYPQYSCSTVAAVWDGLSQVFAHYRALPEVRFIRDYADHPAYITALTASAERACQQHGRPDRLLLSYHGIPQRFAREGDDYPQRCRATTDAFIQASGWRPEQVLMTFQSRFGREPWLTPYTDTTLRALPQQGVRHLHIMCPGFAADCLETLEEVGKRYRALFLRAGGEKFTLIPALNDDPEHVTLLEQLIQAHC